MMSTRPFIGFSLAQRKWRAVELNAEAFRKQFSNCVRRGVIRLQRLRDAKGLGGIRCGIAKGEYECVPHECAQIIRVEDASQFGNLIRIVEDHSVNAGG